MSSRLPERIDPVRLAERGVRLAGELGLERMIRLAAVIVEGAGEAEIELFFAVEALGRVRITGGVSARVFMTCQRCLEPIELALEKPVNLLTVSDDRSASALHDDAEPLIYDEGSLSLVEVVEDELLLALPQEAKHTAGSCAKQHVWRSGEPTLQGGVEQEPNPFAVLEQLKRRN
ncbi:MAG: hypothetical protein DWQ09_12915 [Proteobacteria bacterium]|nr:MAG: hypothetical protein DWQ09_12915 [Pseudomonadota bacterium]